MKIIAKLFFLLIIFSIILISPPPSYAQKSNEYWCIQPESGLCVLFSDCDTDAGYGVPEENQTMCDDMLATTGGCDANTSKKDCIETEVPQGFKCIPELKSCFGGCAYGVDPGCNFTTAEEDNCNAECQTATDDQYYYCHESGDVFYCSIDNNGTTAYASQSVCGIHCPPDYEGYPLSCTQSGEEGINTAIGCIIYSNINPFAIAIIQWAGGIAGGVGMLLFGYAGFLFVTAQGNPRQIQSAKELLTSAIIGIIFIILSAYLLQTIGHGILNLPNF